MKLHSPSEATGHYVSGFMTTEWHIVLSITAKMCIRDRWCLAQIAKELGKTEEYDYFLSKSYNYRNLFNAKTGFFHPKDENGNFVEPFDYRFSGGQGARPVSYTHL